ncbi:Equilibrative nucleotide transporter 2 [Camellia lanceoleosa]|uniref:Equilibrative nucleotide transporter 2 n=1 Tax=Camellia lanceoleosa TaxID=1840588 RepID=A0ACC0GRY6_9ERIC|nr:Equilibrative nucleotide transporter 2 [Camellia lanceoleosa]
MDICYLSKLLKIDDNMEESLTNVESARSALLWHLNQISSNRLFVKYKLPIVEIGEYIATVLLDLAISGKGGIGTYIGICMISGAFRVADAHVQGGMVGDLSFMLP